MIAWRTMRCTSPGKLTGAHDKKLRIAVRCLGRQIPISVVSTNDGTATIFFLLDLLARDIRRRSDDR